MTKGNPNKIALEIGYDAHNSILGFSLFGKNGDTVNATARYFYIALFIFKIEISLWRWFDEK